MAEAEAGIRQRAAKKEISIRNIYTGNGSACYDLKWTKEALENVLDNAVKYSPRGSEILLSVTEYEMYAAVSVKDRGWGDPGGGCAQDLRAVLPSGGCTAGGRRRDRALSGPGNIKKRTGISK